MYVPQSASDSECDGRNNGGDARVSQGVTKAGLRAGQ